MNLTPFSSVRVGPLTLRNRFIKSATNEGMAPAGVPTQALVKHHRDMAAGGVAMTTVAYCAVAPDGRTFPDQILLAPDVVPHLRALTDAVHREGAAACAQITHGGAFTFLPQLSTKYPKSASGGFNAAGVISGRPFKSEMTRADLEQTAAEFVRGARIALDCGFDAVELHMGHGYLLSQFVSPKYNRRRDEFGGSPDARAHFPAMVLRQVLDAVGDRMAVTCKLCATEGFRGGNTADDMAVIARALEAAGAHLLVLSGGMNIESPWAIFGNPLPKEAVEDAIENPVIRLLTRLKRAGEPKPEFRELYQLEHSRKIRAAVKMPLAYLGGVKSMRATQQVLGEGFDAVVLARALIHDPDLVNKFRSGAAAESGCTSCNRCVVTMYTPGGTCCVLRAPNDAALNRMPAAA